MQKKRLVKYEAIIIAAILIVSFIVLLFRDFGLVMIAILAALLIVVTGYGQRGGIATRAAGVLTGTVIVWLLALLSFYLNAKVAHEFDSGGTWAADKALGTGIMATSKYAPMFIAAFFGYDGGNNDSGTLLILGAAVSALVIVGGLHLWKLLSSKYTKS